MAILEIKDVSKDFDGVKALDNLSFDLEEGQITALVGPNGAGKTTLFNVITGFQETDSGTVVYKLARLTNLVPHKISRMGIARTFQNIRLFSHLTVLENLMLARKYETGERLSSALLRSRKMLNEEKINQQRTIELLEEVGLLHKKDALGNELSHGQRRLIEFARVRAMDAQLLLLDEPTAGVFPEMIAAIKKMILNLKETGKTILFIEHDMKVVMDIADRVIVLNYGRVIADGSPMEIQNNEEVITAYLGRHRNNVP